jgi:hypothetical protein
LSNDQIDVMSLLYGMDGPEGVEMPEYGALQLAGVGDFDAIEGLGFLRRKKKRRGGNPALRFRPGGATRRRAGTPEGAFIRVAPQPKRRRGGRINVVPAPMLPPPPQQSPAFTAEPVQPEFEAQAPVDEPPQDILEEPIPEELPPEDEALEGQLGLFKWAKRTIKRNQKTLRAVGGVLPGLIPGAGGVIANAIINRGGGGGGQPAPATPGIVRRPPARPAPRPAARPAAGGINKNTLVIGAAVLAGLLILSRR